MYLAVTGTRERMVHYPLWTVDYSFNGRTFRIIVDGCTGVVLKGTFPADSEHWKKVSRILGSIWAGIFPVLILILFSNLLTVGPVLMLFVLSLWGLGAVSARFLKLAGRNAGMDSCI
jgi:VIT1/CCC1 family predicted Fe2+/Mn2+ transporter